MFKVNKKKHQDDVGWVISKMMSTILEKTFPHGHMTGP